MDFTVSSIALALTAGFVAGTTGYIVGYSGAKAELRATPAVPSDKAEVVRASASATPSSTDTSSAPPVPERLFKYIPATADHHFAILERLDIRFSQPSVLNDPRDCRPHVVAPADPNATVEQMLQRALSRYPRPPNPDQVSYARQQLLRAYTTDVEQRIAESARVLRESMDRLGVLSLTDTPDNAVMWAHYSDNHRGFVIEFDTAYAPLTPQEGETAWEGRPVPVIYQENRVQVACDSASLALPDEVVLVKTSAWQYEREWRVIRERSRASRTVGAGAGEVSLFGIDARAISALYVGADAPSATENRLRAIVAANPNLQHVRISRAEVSPQGDIVVEPTSGTV